MSFLQRILDRVLRVNPGRMPRTGFDELSQEELDAHLPRSQAVLDALIKMHWYEFTEVVLLTVTPPGAESISPDGQPPTCAQEIESLAAELKASLRQCEVSFLALSGDPATVILETTEQIGAELIVLGSNCKSTMERLLLGSVCQSVLNRAKCPVIVAKTPCCLAREISPGFRNILVPVDNSIFSDIAVRWLSSFSWGAETRFIVTAVASADSDLIEVIQSLNQTRARSFKMAPERKHRHRNCHRRAKASNHRSGQKILCRPDCHGCARSHRAERNDFGKRISLCLPRLTLCCSNSPRPGRRRKRAENRRSLQQAKTCRQRKQTDKLPQ